MKTYNPSDKKSVILSISIVTGKKFFVSLPSLAGRLLGKGLFLTERQDAKVDEMLLKVELAEREGVIR
jgi:hypothetical protein